MAKKEKKNPETEEEILEDTAQEVETETNEEDDEKVKLQKELDATKEAHIRTLAEYDNFRKRSIKEKEAIAGDSKALTVKELLPVLDNFERAAMNSDTDLESYRKGVEMTFSSFMDVLKKMGVEQFGEPGEQFDPNIHNAVMHCDDENLEENVITDVFSKGYKMGDRVLRHAMVKVAN